MKEERRTSEAHETKVKGGKFRGFAYLRYFRPA